MPSLLDRRRGSAQQNVWFISGQLEVKRLERQRLTVGRCDQGGIEQAQCFAVIHQHMSNVMLLDSLKKRTLT